MAQSTKSVAWPISMREDETVSLSSWASTLLCIAVTGTETVTLFHLLWNKWLFPCSSGNQTLFVIELCDSHLKFSEHHFQNKNKIHVQITKLGEMNNLQMYFLAIKYNIGQCQPFHLSIKFCVSFF